MGLKAYVFVALPACGADKAFSSAIHPTASDA